ncbi:hypothetical protein PMZ80_006895 [Knufia obscura]|uniref:C2H2-type domain-containing protein n=1 Tax=Knufia obscura TaxID=1635080 RepID=A0ABR0RIN1_9EURO|nr:hypothetical protein PMZ80_006895 [Knufia obscura]
MQSMPRHDGLFELGQTFRYVSPGATHASSLSEASYSGESVYSIETQNHPIRYSTNAASIPTQHTLKLSDSSNAQNLPWQPQSRRTVLRWQPPTVAPSVLPSQPSMPLEDEPEQENDKDVTLVFNDDAASVHTRSPVQMPQPEEVEFSEPTTDSNTSLGSNYQAKKSIKENHSEDDFDGDEDEDRAPADNESDSDYQAQPRKRKGARNTSTKNPRSPNHKRKSSTHSTQGNCRVHKRTGSTTNPAISSHTRRSSKSKPAKKGPIFSRTDSSKTQQISKADRVFPCTFHHFGCPAEFPNKNEWKRHVACQHLQLGYYRCDLDGCNPDNVAPSTSSRRHSSQALAKHTATSPDQQLTDADQDQSTILIYNDFNRKDLFTQHCRRMHGPTRNISLCTSSNKKGTCHASKEDEARFETELTAIRTRCWSIRRKAPGRSNCGFCGRVFDAAYYTGGDGSGDTNAEEKAWEERMEHIGRHYEKEVVYKSGEDVDEDLVEWGVATGVLCRLDDGRAWLVSAELPVDGGDDVRVKSEEQERSVRRARRQPSRTVVVRKFEALGCPVKKEGDSDEDADGEVE